MSDTVRELQRLLKEAASQERALRRDLDVARAKINAGWRAETYGDFWVWSDDPTENHLESMGNDMLVLIRAEQLRSLQSTEATKPDLTVAEKMFAFLIGLECKYSGEQENLHEAQIARYARPVVVHIKGHLSELIEQSTSTTKSDPVSARLSKTIADANRSLGVIRTIAASHGSVAIADEIDKLETAIVSIPKHLSCWSCGEKLERFLKLQPAADSTD